MKAGQMDMAYRNINMFLEVRKIRTMCIEDKNGMLTYDDIIILKRWKEYLEQLYSGDISTFTI